MTKRACASGGTSLVASEPDRLSALPDCLLHIIMSFLKARQVVQTCVLSTRWRHLWCSVPCLDIDIDEFNTGSGLSYLGVPHNDKNWEDFEDFALNLMLRSNIALMDSFRLNISCTKAPYFGSQLAASWLRRAMKYRAPSHSIQLAESSNSWRLKRMYLCNIFLDDRFTKHVFSEESTTTCKQFKNLRNLVLENCDVSDDFQTMALFLETSPNLEKLTLRHCTISNGSKKWSSSQCRSLNVLRANLKLTKIIYKDDVCQLVQHFVHNSENLPNNQFEFRKVD
ncbi:hypothetical protein PR202_ga22408 [Eleusine coracana subsp. coracana]|uniref:F-box domain-containing protein n=1 Tax=Eleusine coracana subsp. coracana TaxID=191504 RepID=A0AAV5D393_ELECO|nr:hypothetical protein PR202_ga22408 [Eleusine coracana subsp. coracana]